MGSRRTTLTSITLVAVATMILASALGVSALAALFFGTAVIAASTAARLLPRVPWSLVAWRIRGELRDPTGPALAAIIGAAVLVSGSGPALAAAAALAILTLKTGTALLLRPSTPRPRLPAGSAAEQWLSRAERAVFAMRRIQAARESRLAERFAETRAGAEEALVLVRRLAAHESAVSQLLSEFDGPRLANELAHLEAEYRAAATTEMRAEVGRALAALRDQTAARARLSSTDKTLLARMRTAAFGLEGLVARLAEIAVLAQGSGDPTAYARVAELGDELDALRAGLTEADSIGRAVVDELTPLNLLEVER